MLAHTRRYRFLIISALAAVLAAPDAAISQTCELTFEGFGSFGGPANFDNGTYRVEWCVNGAQTTTSQFCSTGNALRMTSSSQDPIVWLYVGDLGCTSATIRFDFGAFATTGTSLKYAVSTDAALNCSAPITEYAGSIDLPDGLCHTAEHVVTLGPSDRSVYWKFDHGLPSANAFFLDNVHILLDGCACDAAPPTHDCCTPGAAGCEDPAVEACVCATDDYCCTTEWDAQCIAEVDSLACGDCGGAGSCAGEFDATFGTFFQSGTVCSLWPNLFPTCTGTGPYVTSGTGCGGAGDYAMSFGTGFPYSAATTTCLDLSLASAAALEFSYAKASGLGPRVEISADGGGSFGTLWDGPFGATSGCVPVCVDLTAYAGVPDVRLRFSSASSTANGASFDDIHLVLGAGCATCTDPAPDAGVAPPLCPGGSVALAGSASGGTGGACPGTYGIGWAGPGIVSGADTFSPTVDAPGQYFLTVGCDTCVTYDTVTVAIADAVPLVDAGATASLPCDGGPLQLAATVTGCPGATTLAWTASAGGAILSGADTLTPMVTTAGLYTLSATCAGGCSSADSVRVRDRVPGDFNGDSQVDLADFAQFSACLTGPGATPPAGCACLDFEPDADVDLRDFAALQHAPAAPPALTGACCGTDGLCTQQTATDCLAAGGAYHGDGDACADVICPYGEYRNTVSPITDYFANGAALADDLTLAGLGARDLTAYDLAVYGGGGGAFDVTATLYTDCPGHGGTAIPGTATTFNSVPDDGFVYTLSADLSANPVTLPDTVWMVVTFSTADAGWIVAGPAETGYTVDLFGTDASPWTCATAFTGESAPYAGFWANLHCTTAPSAQAIGTGADAIQTLQTRVTRLEHRLRSSPATRDTSAVRP